MADLKNLGKFAASVAAEAESIVASARRQLEDLAKRRRLELQEVERAAAELGGPFGELFQRAAVVLVRECRISGLGARMIAAGFRLEGGKAIGTDGRADDEFHMGDLLHGHSRMGERGHQLEEGYYRAVLALVQIAPPATVTDAAE